MQRIALIALFALFALALAACGSSSEDSASADKPARPTREYFVWNDPGIASGNVDADYGDCKTQIEADPAITDATPKLAVVSAYIKCMEPKGWKFVNPDAPAQP